MSLASLLGQTAEIFRPTISPNGFGDPRDVWPANPTQTVKCRMQLTSGTERTEGRDVSVAQWKLYLPPDAAISEHDRVKVDGRTFEVVTVYPATNPSGLHHYECDVVTFSGSVPSG